MTPALRRMLQALADAEDREDWYNAEVVADGLQVYLGDDRYSWRTINAGLRLVALSDDTDEDGGLRRYSINETGRALLANPEAEQQVQRALLEGGAWAVRDNQVVPL